MSTPIHTEFYFRGAGAFELSELFGAICRFIEQHGVKPDVLYVSPRIQEKFQAFVMGMVELVGGTTSHQHIGRKVARPVDWLFFYPVRSGSPEQKADFVIAKEATV